MDNIDEDLLNDDDDNDAEYNLDNETEDALLEDDSEASFCTRMKDVRNVTEQDPEDVLDLDVEANDVELNEEEDPEDGQYNSTQDETKSERHNKFTNERNVEFNSTAKDGVKTVAVRKSFNNNNRQFLRGRGRGRGGRGYFNRKESRKVLINPHFKGNVQVPNGTPLLWEQQKNANHNVGYSQQPFKQHVDTIQPWLTPLPPVNQPIYASPNVNFPPPSVLQEPILPQQQNPNWNQCNIPNNFVPQINRNVPVHQRLGFVNNFNQQQQQQPPSPAPFVQPAFQNTFNQPPPPYISQFSSPPPQMNPPLNHQNAFYNHYETPRQMPCYENSFPTQQPPPNQQIYNSPHNYMNSYEPQHIHNINKPLMQKSLMQKSPAHPKSFFPKRNFDNKTFDQRKKKRFHVQSQNLQEVPTIGDVHQVKDFNKVQQTIVKQAEDNSSIEHEDDEIREYRKMIEKQKEKREQILRAKEARRMLTLKTGAEPPKKLAPAPAELVKKFETSSVAVVRPKNSTNTIQVQIQNSKCKNISLQKMAKPSGRVVALAEPPNDANDDESVSFSSSFLSNRKVLCKDQFLPETPLVVIKDLASGTTEVKLYKLCSGIGDVQKLQLSKQERQATIQFKSVASAHAFYKKYQRYMLDLSMIQVSLKPL